MYLMPHLGFRVSAIRVVHLHSQIPPHGKGNPTHPSPCSCAVIMHTPHWTLVCRVDLLFSAQRCFHASHVRAVCLLAGSGDFLSSLFLVGGHLVFFFPTFVSNIVRSFKRAFMSGLPATCCPAPGELHFRSSGTSVGPEGSCKTKMTI